MNTGCLYYTPCYLRATGRSCAVSAIGGDGEDVDVDPSITTPPDDAAIVNRYCVSSNSVIYKNAQTQTCILHTFWHRLLVRVFLPRLDQRRHGRRLTEQVRPDTRYCRQASLPSMVHSAVGLLRYMLTSFQEISLIPSQRPEYNGDQNVINRKQYPEIRDPANLVRALMGTGVGRRVHIGVWWTWHGWCKFVCWADRGQCFEALGARRWLRPRGEGQNRHLVGPLGWLR
mgnify:CR=1 FL=1